MKAADFSKRSLRPRIAVIALLLMLLACALPGSADSSKQAQFSSTPTSKPRKTATPVPPTALPLEYCNGPVCLRSVYAGVQGEQLAIRIDTVDTNGAVLFGEEPLIHGKLVLKLYLSDVYIFGSTLSQKAYSCYAGNDIDEYFGSLAVTCAVLLPRASTQQRLSPADFLRIDLPEFNHFSATVRVLDGLPLAIPATPALSWEWEPPSEPTEQPLLSDTPVITQTLTISATTPVASLTPTPTITPESTSDGGEAQLLGLPVQLENQTITLESAEFDGDLLMVYFTVQNTGSEELSVEADFNFYASNSDGVQLEREYDSCEPFLTGYVPAGESLEGYVCWLGPFTDLVKIFYIPDLTLPDKIFWEVSQ
ncbi:MAG: hypothetical protein AB1894_17025 [Chloroflexota bacterium]